MCWRIFDIFFQCTCHSRLAEVDYTDDFYDDIHQDPDYQVNEQQDIVFEADDEISEGEKESLQRTKGGSEAGTQEGSEVETQEGSEDHSEGQTSIQDIIKGE